MDLREFWKSDFKSSSHKVKGSNIKRLEKEEKKKRLTFDFGFSFHRKIFKDVKTYISYVHLVYFVMKFLNGI